jgi:MFS family permease
VAKVSWIVTVYGAIYFLGSYVSGIAADRFDRKLLLGIGLLGNAGAILCMGFTHQYDLLVALAVVAGVSGTLFHPAANALEPAHNPEHPGMAIGLLGMGSGLGFWVGPWFAGKRATLATWHFAGVSDWQRPLVEAGLAGLVIGVIFLLIAREAVFKNENPSPSTRGGGGGAADQSESVGPPNDASNGVDRQASAIDRDLRPLTESRAASIANENHLTPNGSPLSPVLSARGEREPVPAGLKTASTNGAIRTRSPIGKTLTRRTLAVALVLGFRDMAGVAALSLTSIFLLKAYNQPAGRVGFVVGTMMLAATVVNPLLVWLTPGRRRLPSLTAILLLGGAIIATLPYWPLAAVLPVMCVYMTMQLGSYAVSDAAMLERVPSASRGRVTGLFLLWAGTFSSTGPWIMGRWTDHLGQAALHPHAYAGLFFTVGCCLWLAAASPPLIARLGHPGKSPPIEPFTETSPATMSAVG